MQFSPLERNNSSFDFKRGRQYGHAIGRYVDAAAQEYSTPPRPRIEGNKVSMGVEMKAQEGESLACWATQPPSTTSGTDEHTPQVCWRWLQTVLVRINLDPHVVTATMRCPMHVLCRPHQGGIHADHKTVLFDPPYSKPEPWFC